MVRVKCHSFANVFFHMLEIKDNKTWTIRENAFILH